MKKILIVCLFAFILSAGSAFAIAMPALILPKISSPKLGKVQNMNPLTLTRSVVGVPVTSGNYIVWEDMRDNGTTGRDIYRMDKNTGVELALCTETGNQTAPYIDGNIATWTDTRLGHSEIYYYYMDIKREIRVSSLVSRYVKGISGNNILAMESQGAAGYYELIAYNYPSNQLKIIASSLTLSSSAAIDGNIVVWTDSSSHVHAYDLSLNKEIVASTSTAMQSEPTVSEDMIVWKDYRSNSLGDIWGYDISAKKEFLIYFPSTTGLKSVHVGKRYVVFEQNHKIYAYHIDTKILSTLANGTPDYANPSIKNNVVVWTNDETSYGGNIFTATLPDVPAVKSFVVGDGSSQRFYVNKVKWVFNTDTNIPQLIADGSIVNAVKIINLGTRAKTSPISQNLVLNVSDFSYDSATRTLTWNYHTTAVDKSVPAGLYNTTIFFSYITSGDNTHPVANVVNYFYRLKGDTNGDAKVDASDLNVLENAFGAKPGDAKWNSNADFDKNSNIDFMDYLEMKADFGSYIETL